MRLTIKKNLPAMTGPHGLSSAVAAPAKPAPAPAAGLNRRSMWTCRLARFPRARRRPFCRVLIFAPLNAPMALWELL